MSEGQRISQCCLCFEDKIIQEVLRQILETVYEPMFSDNLRNKLGGRG